MKKLFFFFAMSTLFTLHSCKKSGDDSNDDGGGNTFKLGTEAFVIDHVSSNSTEVSFTAHDTKGNALGIIFDDEYPTAAGTFKVVANANDPDEVELYAAKNYAAQRWSSTESFGPQTIQITIVNGKAVANISNITLYSGTELPVIVKGTLKQP